MKSDGVHCSQLHYQRSCSTKQALPNHCAISRLKSALKCCDSNGPIVSTPLYNRIQYDTEIEMLPEYGDSKHRCWANPHAPQSPFIGQRLRQLSAASLLIQFKVDDNLLLNPTKNDLNLSAHYMWCRLVNAFLLNFFFTEKFLETLK